jgi:hypothetical protein
MMTYCDKENVFHKIVVSVLSYCNRLSVRLLSVEGSAEAGTDIFFELEIA